jgi:hypothetical protein
VEELNFSIATLPPFYNITTQTTTPYPCCEVHVGSVCRPDQNFDFPAKTKMGRWQPEPSFNRTVGYFSIVPCDQQAVSVPRACPRVKIKEINTAYLQWPHCVSVKNNGVWTPGCSNAKAQAEFNQTCNRTLHPEFEEKEKEAHRKKVKSMKTKSKELETWTAERMPTVQKTKQVVDCFADRLPRRYNSLALPKMRSGFDKMPLHNECRLHSCTAKQCLEVSYTCKVPYVHEAPEVQCNLQRPNGTFTCVDKVSISTNNPMSLYFGIAWFVIGSIFLCAGIATFIRQYNAEGGFRAQGEMTALAAPRGF